MLSLNRIEETVENLLNTRFAESISFPEQELADAAKTALNAAGSKDDAHRVEKETELILRAHDDLFVSDGKVYPKNVFFRGMEFRVVPSAAELEKAVLFPGAAFIPFVSGELFTDDFELTDEDGEQLPAVSVSARFSEIAPAFMMLGHSGIIDHLSAESEENRMALKGASSLDTVPVRVTAFDLSAFYRKHEFNEGDALVVTVKDWSNGEFSVRLQRGKEIPSEDRKKEFVHDFEQALTRVCETERDYMEISQQIAEAYLFAFEDGHDLRHRPELSLEEYRKRMNEIGIRRDGADWLLVPVDELDTPGQFEQSLLKIRAEHDAKIGEDGHHCSCGHDHGHDHDHEHGHNEPETTLDPDISPDKFSASAGTMESIDAILAELNAPVNSVELASMIYDAMANGEEQFEGFRARTMDFLDLKFADDAQECAFINFLEDNWEISKDYFNPHEDAFRAPLRTRLLDLTNDRIETSLQLLERYKKTGVPKETAEKLASIHRDIVETLSLLNSDVNLGEEEAYEDLELRVGDIEDAWDSFTESLGR